MCDELIVAGGVDIGSTSAKAVILCDGEVIASPILPTGTSPTLAGEKALKLALEKTRHSSNEDKLIVATGYGRVLAPFANETVTEITCHGRGAHHLSSGVRTVIDIGGQDAKAIFLDENGRIVNFLINDKCAAGTGRFLEFISSSVLGVPLQEMGMLSRSATQPAKISSRCTVFAQTEIVSLLAFGETKENIIAGLHKVIAERVGIMVRGVGVRPLVMLTGGVAKNDGVRRALEEELKTEIIVPTTIDPQLVGALGAAIIANDHIRARLQKNNRLKNVKE